jgi:hypothetical protein
MTDFQLVSVLQCLKIAPNLAWKSREIRARMNDASGNNNTYGYSVKNLWNECAANSYKRILVESQFSCQCAYATKPQCSV